MTSEHASTPLLTTDRISQVTSTSAAIHQQSSFQKTSTAMSLTAPKVPDFNPAQSNQVTGWNIFWTILSFTVACATHPINSGVFLPPEYRHLVHLTPINSAIDASSLLFAIIKQVGRARGHFFQACALVVAIRLERNRNPMLQERSLRIFLAIVFTLQYSKLWGYHGIPLIFAWSTVSFGSWVLMELIYILGSFHYPLNDQLPRGRTLTMAITRTYFAAEFMTSYLPMQLVLVYHSIHHPARLGEMPQWLLALFPPVGRLRNLNPGSFLSECVSMTVLSMGVGHLMLFFGFSLVKSIQLLAFHIWEYGAIPRPLVSGAWVPVQFPLGPGREGLIWNFILFGLYCAFYDSTGTWKSDWTEYLP